MFPVGMNTKADVDENGILHIEVDLNKEGRISSTGKSRLLGTVTCAVPDEAFTDVKIQLNVTKPIPVEERVPVEKATA